MATLASARSKLRWAERRLDELREDIRRFLDLEPYALTHETDEESGVERWRLHVKHEPPVEDWAMIFGDCIHNARSALDQMVWQLSGSDPADTASQFPIFLKREMFDRHGLRPIARLDRRGKAFVKWLQPHRRDNPVGKVPLWPIHLLDAGHEHKTIVAVVSALESSELKVQVPPYTRVRQRLGMTIGPLEAEAIVAEGTFAAFNLDGSPSQAKVKVNAEFAYDIAIMDSGSGVTVVGTPEIARFLSCVEDIITNAERLL